MIPHAIVDSLVHRTWPIESLCVGGLLLAADPAFVDLIATAIVTHAPAYRRWGYEPTACPLAYLALERPPLRVACLGLIRHLDTSSEMGWT